MHEASAASVPAAPLSHGNEIEHRRLLAIRANTNIDEQGEFTPTLTFATPGDLSNAYTTQDGDFWRVGLLVFFSLKLDVTPTFTTAAGEARIGLHYTASATLPDAYQTAVVSGTGVTWPGGRTSPVGLVRAGDETLEVAFAGSGAAVQNLAAADITSGVALQLSVTGCYAID